MLNCRRQPPDDPLGNVVVSRSSAEGILVAEADLEAPRPTMPVRSRKRYSILTADTVSTGAYLAQFDPLSPAGDEVFAALCRFSASGMEDFLEKAARFLVRAADQGNRLVCLPPMKTEMCSGAAEKLSGLLAGSDVVAVANGPAGEGRETVVFSADGVLGRFPGEQLEPLDTPAGRIGAVWGKKAGAGPLPHARSQWRGTGMGSAPGDIRKSCPDTGCGEQDFSAVFPWRRGCPCRGAFRRGAGRSP